MEGPWSIECDTREEYERNITHLQSMGMTPLPGLYDHNPETYDALRNNGAAAEGLVRCLRKNGTCVSLADEIALIIELQQKKAVFLVEVVDKEGRKIQDKVEIWKEA